MNKFLDAQQALSFLVQQTTHIESQVYEIQYPDIQYPGLVPIDTSANEWAKTVTYYSVDKVGQAEWFHHEAKDMPRADSRRSQLEHGIELAGIGYGYTLEELGQAMMVPNTNLTMERAAAARRAYEEFMDTLVLTGDTDKNMEGLINNAAVTSNNAAATGTGSSMAWADKTGDQILTDVNNLISGAYEDSLTVELCDTVLLPIAALTLISTKRMPDIDKTVLRFLREDNTYTAVTGQPLTIRGVRGLEDAGDSSTGRMVAYRKAMEVLKLHLPMPHRFLPPWQTSPLGFDVPGIFRTGGVEIRRPGAVRYLDGIVASDTA